MSQPRTPPVVVRMPLAVGSTCLLSAATAFIFAGLTMVALVGLVMVLLMPKGDAVLLGGLVCFGAVLFCGLVTFIQGRNALTTRPSDLLLDANGIRVAGGPLDGVVAPWSALVPPGAETTETGGGSKAVWYLGLTTHGGRVELAVVTEAGDVRSVKAARASIEAVVKGREALERTPAVQRELLRCQACQGVVSLDDAEVVACAFCGAQVAVPLGLREQVRTTRQLDASRAQSNERVRKLHVQAGAEEVTLWFTGLAAVVAGTFVVSWSVIAALAFWNPSWGPVRTFLLLLPFLVVGVATALARLVLANRAALRVLGLGYGALAPERTGDPPRCRRCHGPLGGAGAAGLERCAYCDADNLTGPDLRLTVDEPGRSDVALEVMLAQVGHEKRQWRAIAITMALLVLGWGVFSVALWG